MGLAGAPPWGVSASDLAVGTWVWVLTRGIRRSPTAEARTSENRLGEPECLLLWDNWTRPRNLKTVYVLKQIYPGIILPEREDLSRSRLRAGDREQPSVRTSATGQGLNLATRATRFTGTWSGESLDLTESVTRWCRAHRG